MFIQLDFVTQILLWLSFGLVVLLCKAQIPLRQLQRNFPVGKVVDTSHESRWCDLCCGLSWFVSVTLSRTCPRLCRKVSIMEFGLKMLTTIALVDCCSLPARRASATRMTLTWRMCQIYSHVLGLVVLLQPSESITTLTQMMTMTTMTCNLTTTTLHVVLY